MCGWQVKLCDPLVTHEVVVHRDKALYKYWLLYTAVTGVLTVQSFISSARRLHDLPLLLVPFKRPSQMCVRRFCAVPVDEHNATSTF